MEQPVTSIRTESKVLVLGLSGVGKTTLIKRIIFNNYKDYDIIYIFCNTAKMSGDWDAFKPFVNATVNIKNIKKVLRKQKEIVTKSGKDSAPKMLLIIDDVLDSGVNFYGKDKKFWIGVLSTARHINLTLILSLQALSGTIPPGIRGQIDTIYMMKTNTNPRVILDILPPIVIDDKCVSANRFKVMTVNALKGKYKCIKYDVKEADTGQVFTVDMAPEYSVDYYRKK